MSAFLHTRRVASHARIQQTISQHARLVAGASRFSFHRAASFPSAATPALPAASHSTLQIIRLPLARQSVRHFARKFGDDGASGQGQQQSGGQHQEAKGDQKTPEGEKPEEPANAILGVGIIFFVVGLGVYLIFRTPAPEEEEPFYTRWPKSIRGIVYGDSPLLPPETLDATGRRPRTVVLNFDKTLVHCGWSRLGGWEVRKRPGVDQLIERLHLAGYELVLWANMPMFEVEPTLAELDPLGYFKHKLYNESTNYKFVDSNKMWPSLVKDLSRLQRDPKRLIVIDTDDKKYSQIGDNQNVLIIPPFVDDLKDRELTKVLKILEDVKRYNVHDTSQIVRRFNANPNEDLFVKEREAAALAIRNLKGGDKAEASSKRSKKASTASSSKDEKEEPDTAAPKQSWGAWLKSKLSTTKAFAAQPAPGPIKQ